MPHLEVDLERLLANIDAVHPDVERMLVSARTGEGIEEWRTWLAERVARAPRARPCDRRGLARRRARALERGLAARREASDAAVLAAAGRRASPSCAIAWPSAARAAGGSLAVGAPAPAPRTRATSRSSSCTR